MKPPTWAKNAMFEASLVMMLIVPRMSCIANHRAIKYLAFILYIW